MTVLSQKEAVFGAVMLALSAKGLTFDNKTPIGEVVKVHKDIREATVKTVYEGFKAKTVELKTEYKDEDLKSYTSSLVNNWFRKDKRLNGDVTYEAKNPGSRAGAGDKMLKNLKALLAAKTAQKADDAVIEQITKAVEARQAEIAASKADKFTIDASELPEELRYLVGNDADGAEAEAS